MKYNIKNLQLEKDSVPSSVTSEVLCLLGLLLLPSEDSEYLNVQSKPRDAAGDPFNENFVHDPESGNYKVREGSLAEQSLGQVTLILLQYESSVPDRPHDGKTWQDI